MKKKLRGGRVLPRRHTYRKERQEAAREIRNLGNTRDSRRRRVLLDETFGAIEYHARIIANWRTRVSMGPDGMLLDQANRIVELIKTLPPGDAETTVGGHDRAG